MLKRRLFVICLGLFVGLSQPGLPSFAQQRTIRVAVLDFSMPQQNSDLHQFAPTLNQLITNQLETSLGSAGMYQLVERKQIETLLNEHQLIRNGDIDPQTAARLKRIHGVDALIFGSVDDYFVNGARQNRQFSMDDLSVSAKVSYKMVNTTTGNILVTGQANGHGKPAPAEASRIEQNTKMAETGAVLTSAACRILRNCPRTVQRGAETIKPKQQSIDGREFIETIKAFNDAAVAEIVTQMAEKIQTKKAEEVKETRVITKSLKGQIIEVDGELVYISGIPSSAVQVGDKLIVKRNTTSKSRNVSYTKPVGDVEIMELQESVIVGRFSTTHATMKPLNGDIVTNP